MQVFLQSLLQWVGALGIIASILIVVVAYFYAKAKPAKTVVDAVKDPAAAIFDQLAELLKQQQLPPTPEWRGQPSTPAPPVPPAPPAPPVVKVEPKVENKVEVKHPHEDWRILSHRLIAKLLEIFKANNNLTGAKLLVQVGRTLYDDSVVQPVEQTKDELSQEG